METISGIYENHAKETVKKIREQLKYGSNAAINEEKRDLKRIFAVRAIVTMGALTNALLYGKGADFPVMAKLNSLAVAKYGYAQCGEQSQAAFVDLAIKNVYPLDLCMTTKGFHNLLAFGRDPKSDINDISTWGDDAIVCDVWANKVYPLAKFLIMQEDKESGRYASDVEGTPAHYLSGELSVINSIQNESDLIEFKEKMNIANDINDWFSSSIDSDEDLKDDFDELVQRYKKIAESVLQYNQNAMPYLLQIKESIENLNKYLLNIPSKKVSNFSFFSQN